MPVTPKNDFYAGLLYHTFFDPFTRYMRNHIAELAPPEASVLDVGCGTGHQLLQMAPRVRAGLGIDRSDRMIAFARRQEARRKNGNISFDLADAADLSRFDDNEFDLATMTLVLHEMETDLRLPAIKEMIRVSRRQIIADYAASPALLSAMAMHGLELTVGILHYHFFRSYLAAGGGPGLFRKTGLRVVREKSALMGMVRIWECDKKE
ncbi:MAG: class I SAM-dependent methyltransferase [Desulfosudaceae bacterium]